MGKVISEVEKSHGKKSQKAITATKYLLFLFSNMLVIVLKSGSTRHCFGLVVDEEFFLLFDGDYVNRWIKSKFLLGTR